MAASVGHMQNQWSGYTSGAADLPSVGQLRPRDVVAFERVSHQAARSLLLRQESCLEADDLLLA